MPEPLFMPRDAFAEGRGRFHEAVKFSGLWVAGDIAALAMPTVAVVGSRAPSEAGRRLAFDTARELARAGVCVLSGLALGIDGAAHAGAVDAGRPTVGVLGGGHRHFHPRRNLALAERIIANGGAVLSPFPPDEPARPYQFLQRNGVVAALADAVVVVEAAARSGALNTASWAGDLSIPVFAFPGDVDRPKVAGCLALLRDGATLVRSATDILEDLGIASPRADLDTRPANRPASQTSLLDLLRAGEADLDTLIQHAGQSPSEVVGTLSALEVEGVVERRPGQRFALTSAARR